MKEIEDALKWHFLREYGKNNASKKTGDVCNWFGLTYVSGYKSKTLIVMDNVQSKQKIFESKKFDELKEQILSYLKKEKK